MRIIYGTDNECPSRVPLKHLDVSVGKLVAVVGLVDYLRDANNVALVIAYRHRQYERGFVSGSHVDSAVESRILQKKKLKINLKTKTDIAVITRQR